MRPQSERRGGCGARNGRLAAAVSLAIVGGPSSVSAADAQAINVSQQAQARQLRVLKEAEHADRSCLLFQGDGCRSIQDKERCTASRDGQRWQKWNGRLVQGQPCVWCGPNGKCPGDIAAKGSVCEPLSWALEETAVAERDYEIATCDKGSPLGALLNSTGEMSPDNSFSPMDGAIDRACRGSHPLDSGFGIAKPFFGMEKSYAMWTARDLRHCQSLCMGDCTGVEWREEDNYCEVWSKPIHYSARAPGYQCFVRNQVSTSGGPSDPSGMSQASHMSSKEPDASCLDSVTGGCTSIDDMTSCLKSRDGRGGLDVHGEPCVWCGGAVCNNETESKCDSYSKVVVESSMFFSADSGSSGTILSTSACRDGVPMPVRVTEPPRSAEPSWVRKKPSEHQMDCLSWYDEGCHMITDKRTCLGSRDGRGNDGRHGLKYHGEPCVWCDGPCHSNSDNACEPFDFLMKGEAQALFTFYGKDRIEVASCSEKVSLASLDFSCLSTQTTGCPTLKDQATCVGSRDGRGNISNGSVSNSVVGQPCVWCKPGDCGDDQEKCEAFDLAWINVPNPSVTFVVSDGKYNVGACKDGEKRRASILPPVVLSKEATGDEVVGNAGAQCGGSGWTGSTKCAKGTACTQVAGKALYTCSDLQKLWGQCGGLGWTGPTRCPDGADCKGANPWLSRCLPGENGIPRRGRFISSKDGEVWWQAPSGLTKHLVQDRSCLEKPEKVQGADLDKIETGTNFSCSMVPNVTQGVGGRPAAQPLRQLLQPMTGHTGLLAPPLLQVSPKLQDDSRVAESESGDTGDSGSSLELQQRRLYIVAGILCCATCAALAKWAGLLQGGWAWCGLEAEPDEAAALMESGPCSPEQQLGTSGHSRHGSASGAAQVAPAPPPHPPTATPTALAPPPPPLQSQHPPPRVSLGGSFGGAASQKVSRSSLHHQLRHAAAAVPAYSASAPVARLSSCAGAVPLLQVAK